MGKWPGKTVEKKDGTYSYKDKKYMLIDLPGSYGLSGNSDEEVITEKFIKSGEADLILVVDEGNIIEKGRHEELIELGGKYAGFIKIRQEAENWQIA